MSARFPPVGQLVPHRGSALLIERVLEERVDGITCSGRVPAGAPLVRDGRVPSFVGLEMAAQAAAAYEGLQRLRQSPQDEPRIGYLVSLSDVAVERPEMAVDVPFVVTVRSLAGVSPLFRCEAMVEGDGGVYVRGVLTTMVAPAPPRDEASAP